MHDFTPAPSCAAKAIPAFPASAPLRFVRFALLMTAFPWQKHNVLIQVFKTSYS